jgi:hypothetical protein
MRDKEVGKMFLRFSSLAMTVFLLIVFVLPVLSQDDEDGIPAKVVEGKRQVGKAELVTNSGDVKINFGYDINLWLDGGSRLLIINPQSGTRGTGIKCIFREYKVDPRSPKDSSRWEETGSGMATLQMSASGEVRKIQVAVTLTKKVVGDDEVAVNEKPRMLEIVLD